MFIHYKLKYYFSYFIATNSKNNLWFLCTYLHIGSILAKKTKTKLVIIKLFTQCIYHLVYQTSTLTCLCNVGQKPRSLPLIVLSFLHCTCNQRAEWVCFLMTGTQVRMLSTVPPDSGLNSDSENTSRQKGVVADGLFSLISTINKCGLTTILKNGQENTCWVYLSVIGFK